jgi:penicillin-binding protein 1A
MLSDVVNHGTGMAARALERPAAGKTGTTNDFTDAWFIGFSPSLTCGVYVGFDDHRTLGAKEEGAHVALPIWMEFMGEALKEQPAEDFPNSPLLTNPEQVQEILASTGTERLLAGANASAAGGNAPSARPAGSATNAGTPAPAPATGTTSRPASPPASTETRAPGSPGTSAPSASPPPAAPGGQKPAPAPAPVAKAEATPAPR